MHFAGHALTSEPATLDAMSMQVLVGKALSGTTVTSAQLRGSVGHPTWDPERLLADLELRLGLVSEPIAPLVRAQRLSARIAGIPHERFYSRSYRRDPIGTAAVLLDWRDELVLAGWDGGAVAGGGPRLDALAELEAESEPPLGEGFADRVRAVEGELARCVAGPYASIRLVDNASLWPGRWRRILAYLERAGTPVEQFSLPSSNRAGGDLGQLQASVAGEENAGAFVRDGSVIVLRAETSTEAALALAALLVRSGEREDAVIVRGGATAILDAALAAQGLAPTGSKVSSRLRPALQVLPLAIELLYAPRDPYRLLDLLTLPVAPLERVTRRALARAVSTSPGVGGRVWLEAKARLHERLAASADPAAADPSRRAQEQLELIEGWLEGPLHDPVTGAPREALADTANRVAAWARGQIARQPDDEVLLAALRQAQELTRALAFDPRERIDQVAARHLVADVSAPMAAPTWHARAGRINAVDQPGALLARSRTVIWWCFVTAGPPSRVSTPWRRAERGALAAAGVELCDPAALLAAETASWWQPVVLADARLVLVIPEASAGDRLEAHPLWSEIQAAVPASDLARITITARDLLAGRAWFDPAPEVESLPSLDLPAPRARWEISRGLAVPPPQLSASAIETLVGCPLRFVLEHVAGIRPGRLSEIPPAFVLAGTLGHRIVEELHAEGAFAADPMDLARRVGELFDELLPSDAAPLLLPGASIERQQVRRQLVETIVALSQALAKRDLTIAGVEVPTEVPWRGRVLTGRIDLLATRSEGEVVVDLKWGMSRYRELIARGRSVQLAVYSYLRRIAARADRPVPAAYFSLSRAELIAADDLASPGQSYGAASAAETWQVVERTAVAVLSAIEAGSVPVTGVRDALTLGDAFGASDLLTTAGGAACEYCECDPLCGRRWEAYA